MELTFNGITGAGSNSPGAHMQTIWKYELRLDGYQEIETPDLSSLSVGVQDGKIMLWCLIKEHSDVKKPRGVWIFGTGHTIPDWSKTNQYVHFVGTVQLKQFV